MVEIIPYTEDDEDQSNWVPLTPAASPTNGPGGALRSNDSTSAATSAQTVRGHGAPSSNMSPAAVQSKNTNDNDGTTHSVSIDNHHLAESQESAVFVENNVDTDEEENEDDHDWQAIPSYHNDPPTQEESQNSNGGASPASSVVDQSTSLSWGKQIISHLTSTATATTTSATTELEEEYVSESEDDIVWSKADTLTDRDPMLNSSARRDRASTEKEYDDDKISSMKVSSSQKIHVTAEADGTSKFEQPPSQTKPQQRVPLELYEEKAKDEDEESKFRRVNEEQPQANQNQYNNQYNQTQSNNKPRTTYVKTKLQQKLIHDPLRALPFSFLCHLYHEAKLQFTKAWNAYTMQNELATIMAPLSLFVLVALVGIGFIGVGLVGLATVMLHYLVNVSVSFSAWMIEYSWRMAYQLVWMSVCTFLILGGMVWVWLRMGAKLPSWWSALFFETPSISTFVPWIIALTSPSVYEAMIIIFSLSMSVSVLIPGSHVDECLLSTGRNEEDPTCLVGGEELDDHYSFALASIAGAFLIAILNVAVVAFAANWLEDSNGKQLADSGKSIATKSSSEESTESTPPPCSSNGSRYLDQVQRHCLCTCHTISVLSLAGLSIIVLIIQTIYTHFLNEGGNILYSLANGLGVVGCNILYMALGIFLLITLCNITAESITINNVAFANGISVGAISRNALKQSILEISSNAVWSKDDKWSGLLGILSDDDGALRVAILEWVIDRWTASSSTSTDETGTSHTASSSESMDSESSEGFTEPVRSGSGVENNASNDDQAKPNSFQSNISHDHPHSSNNQTQQENTNEHNNNTSASNQQSSQPSYKSLQSVILQLDADETLIPTIERYRAWVYSLPPSQNAAVYVALWKMCPAAAVLGLVAFYCIGWAVIKWSVLTLAWIVGASTSRGASHSDIMLVMGMVATMLSPLLFLEYQRTSQWWATVVNQLEEADTSTHTSNDSDRRDIVMVILRADSTDVGQHRPMNDQLYMDSSSVFHQIWLLLLESIALLESAIQPVRYATVASAAVDLTSDTVCLLDLALEVKKRGLIGGVGIIIWDAFQYSLSKEIKQRKNEAGDATNSSDGTRERQQSQDEEGDLGGKYTGSVVSAVGNLGKMSHNISCLMESRSENDKASNNGSDGCDGNGAAKSNEDEGARRQSEASASEDMNTKQEDSKCTSSIQESLNRKDNEAQDEDLPCDSSVSNAQEEEASFHEDGKQIHEEKQDPSREENEPKQSADSDDNGGGLMPFLVGGGLAVAGIVGTVAGIVVHNSGNNNNNHHEEGEKKAR